MYNGSINTGDSSDLNILKQQAELISVINSKLSEFTGLRGTIADVLGIFKSEKSNVAEMADAIGRTVSAGNELNTVSQLGRRSPFQTVKQYYPIFCRNNNRRKSTKGSFYVGWKRFHCYLSSHCRHHSCGRSYQLICQVDQPHQRGRRGGQNLGGKPGRRPGGAGPVRH